jgi:hypothetical protein
MMPGAVLALHTASETLGWNPHAHLVVADGAFTKEDLFVRMSHWDEAELQKQFSSDLLHLLVERELMDIVCRFPIYNTLCRQLTTPNPYAIGLGKPLKGRCI